MIHTNAAHADNRNKPNERARVLRDSKRKILLYIKVLCSFREGEGSVVPVDRVAPQRGRHKGLAVGCGDVTSTWAILAVMEGVETGIF